jgi:hypothetical protein
MHGLDRHVVISADCHGGADLTAYREYLETAYRDEFDRWAAGYTVPYEDMNSEDVSAISKMMELSPKSCIRTQSRRSSSGRR